MPHLQLSPPTRVNNLHPTPRWGRRPNNPPDKLLKAGGRPQLIPAKFYGVSMVIYWFANLNLKFVLRKQRSLSYGSPGVESRVSARLCLLCPALYSMAYVCMICGSKCDPWTPIAGCSIQKTRDSCGLSSAIIPDLVCGKIIRSRSL